MLPGRRHTRDGLCLFLVENKEGDCKGCRHDMIRIPTTYGSMTIQHAWGYVAELVSMTQDPIDNGSMAGSNTRGAGPEMRYMDRICVGNGLMS